MIRTRHLVAASVWAFLLCGDASAQLPKASDNRIVIGNIHLRPSSVDAHKRFWIDTVGGQPRNVANIYTAMFPDGFVELGDPYFMGCPAAAGTSGSGTCEHKPWGGTKGSNFNHVGFSVPDLRSAVDRVSAAGYPIVTRAELPPEFATG